MKKWISLLLALTLLMTAASSVMSVSAEETAEPEKAFVIDGVLDEWYRDDVWAQEAGCYFYFNSIDDTTLPVISRDFENGNGELDIPEFYEAVKVKIYAAYDANYAYFYVDVEDPNIISSLGTNADGTPNTTHQQMENIDFYVDVDTANWDQHFNLAEPVYDVSETHFRMMAHDLTITDTQSATKYNLENQPMGDPTSDKKGASNYFSSKENCFPFHKKDADGKLIGYGCEVRFPLVYMMEGKEDYTNFYYNIVVTNSKTDMDVMPCVIGTGYRWWLDYSTGKTVELNLENNPFFNKPDDNKIAADAVTVQLQQLPAQDVIEDWEIYLVEEARAAYDALTEEQKTLVDADAYAQLVALEEYFANKKPDEPQYTPGDVDESGVIDAVDALWVLQAAVEKRELSDTAVMAGDMNTDSKLDATDALAILKLAVGK